ncbi:MAG: tetratricopeptide repeat protein [Candidatus Coatesbacteria bacterium]
MTERRRDAAWLAALTLAALALRLPRLETVPPGMVIDEGFQGLQGVALWSGESLPTIPEQGRPPTTPQWAVWVAISTRILGVNLAAARLPAAVIGALSTPLAWMVVRAICGRAAAWAAALFLCGSFWHVQFSRQCFPWVPVVAEGLLVGWLLLAPRFAGRPRAAAAAGLVAGLATCEYLGAFALAIWGAPVVLGPVFVTPGSRVRSAGYALAFALGLVAGLAPIALGLQGRAQLARTVQLGGAARSLPGPGHLVPIANLFVSVDAQMRQWTNHPAGAARLSIPERLLLLAGLAALFLLRELPAPTRLAVGLMLPVMLLPEMAPGELHLSRGIGALAPIALLAGLGGRLVAQRLGRRAFAALIVAGVVNAAWTGWHLYAVYAVDPGVRQAFQFSGCEAARFVARQAREAPLRLTASNYSYEDGPVFRFLIWREMRDGRVIPLTEEETRRAGFKPTMDFFRHPVTGEPHVFVLGTDRYPADRTVCLLNIHQLLETGRLHEAAGRPANAEAYYRYLLSLFPDSVSTRVALARLLWRAGRREEAARLGAAPGQ